MDIMGKKFKDLNEDEKREYYRITNKIYRTLNREKINAICLKHYYNVVKTDPVKMKQRAEKNRKRYQKTITDKIVHCKEQLRTNNFIVRL